MSDWPPMDDAARSHEHYKARAEDARNKALASDEKRYCRVCKAVLFELAGNYAALPGHIYSSAGKAEVHITRLCEYCFDEITDIWIEPTDLHLEDEGDGTEPEIIHEDAGDGTETEIL